MTRVGEVFAGSFSFFLEGCFEKGLVTAVWLF